MEINAHKYAGYDIRNSNRRENIYISISDEVK